MRDSGSYKKLLGIITEKAAKAKSKLLLLDFDGTLVDFTADITAAVPPEDLLTLLKKLAALPECRLVVITGRSMRDIEKFIGGLGTDIVAEHGVIIRENMVWKVLIEVSTFWKEKIYPVIRKYTYCLPDSVIEEKTFSIAWHYRNLDKSSGRLHSKALMKELMEITRVSDLKIIDGNKVVEIMSSRVSKGYAVEYLVNNGGFDFILSVGDDTTDEDMFRILSGNRNAFTVKTGRGDTAAKYTLDNVRQVKKLLTQLFTVMEKSSRHSANNY